MSVYAISDLHLSFSADKKMDVFGDVWEGYVDKIKAGWLEAVSPSDSVILPGDTSWATYIDEAAADFDFIEALPGTKYLLKGNHDYWWTTIKKMNAFLEKNNFNTIKILHNDSVALEDAVFCGTRGWKHPGDDDFEDSDVKLYNRELQRLEISLGKATQMARQRKIIAALHYPPFDIKGQPTEFTGLLKKYNVSKCIYGHIHGEGSKKAVNGIIEGIEYLNVSGDYLGFRPHRLI